MVEGGKEAARLAQTLPILSGFLHYRDHHQLGTSSHQEAQSGFASGHHCLSRVCGPPGTTPDGQTGQASSAFSSLTHALP